MTGAFLASTCEYFIEATTFEAAPVIHTGADSLHPLAGRRPKRRLETRFSTEATVSSVFSHVLICTKLNKSKNIIN